MKLGKYILYTLSLLLAAAIGIGAHIVFLEHVNSGKEEQHDVDIAIQVDYPTLSQLNPQARAEIEKVIYPYVQEELDSYWEVIGTRNVLNRPYYPNNFFIDQSFVDILQGTQTPFASIGITSSIITYTGDPSIITIRFDKHWLNTDETEPEITARTFHFHADTGEQYTASDFFVNSNMHMRQPEDWESMGTYRAVDAFAEQHGYQHWLSGKDRFLEAFVITDEGLLALKNQGTLGRAGEPNELLIPFDYLAPHLNPCGPLGSLSSNEIGSNQQCPSPEL